MMRYLAMAFLVMAGVAMSADSPERQAMDIKYARYLIAKDSIYAPALIRNLRDENNPEWAALLEELKTVSPNASISLPADLEEGFALPPHPRMDANRYARLAAEFEEKRKRSAAEFLEDAAGRSRERARILMEYERRDWTDGE